MRIIKNRNKCGKSYDPLIIHLHVAKLPMSLKILKFFFFGGFWQIFREIFDEHGCQLMNLTSSLSSMISPTNIMLTL